MFPSLYQTANIFAYNFKSLAWTRPSLLLQGVNPVSLPSWHPDSPPHPGAWSLASGRSANMNWQRCSGHCQDSSWHLSLITPILATFFFIIDERPIMPLGSGHGTQSRLPSSRRCSPSHPTPSLPKSPELLVVLEPAAPDPGSLLPAWARAEQGSSRQDARPGRRVPGAAFGVGRSSRRSVSSPAPSPKRTSLLPPARSPPSAAPPPPPARAGPEPPRQPASEGSALGWDLEEAAKEETAAVPRASSPAPTSGLPEESRGSRSGDEAGEEDPGGCAPVSLPRRWRRRLQVSEARSPRGPRLAPRPRGADRPTDPYRPTDGQIGRAWAPTHAGAAPRLAPRPPPLRAAPAARRPQTTTSRPRPVVPDPSGQT